MVTDLAGIAGSANTKEAENEHFRAYLTTCEPVTIDRLVTELEQEISPQIDCTRCGNCCKSLMIVVTDEEADRLSTHLQRPREDFDQCYLEKGSNGMMVINRIPCHFLNDNKCTVYENRFGGCREFPALHIPGFTKRLFTVFMHYGRCPIIFNVVERMKERLGWIINN